MAILDNASKITNVLEASKLLLGACKGTLKVGSILIKGFGGGSYPLKIFWFMATITGILVLSSWTNGVVKIPPPFKSIKSIADSSNSNIVKAVVDFVQKKIKALKDLALLAASSMSNTVSDPIFIQGVLLVSLGGLAALVAYKVFNSYSKHSKEKEIEAKRQDTQDTIALALKNLLEQKDPNPKSP